MQRTLLALVPFALFALLARAIPVHGGELLTARPSATAARVEFPRPGETDDLASAVPGNALLYVEAPGLSSLLERGLDDPSVRAALATPLGRALTQEHRVSLPALLSKLEALWGRAPLPTLATLTDRGVALALAARGERDPATLLLLRSSDPDELDAVLRDGLDRIAEAYHVPGAFARPATTVAGADVWLLGEELVVARRAGSLWVGNDRPFVRAALEGSAGTSLAARDAFRANARSRDDSHLAWGWLDLPGLAAAGDGDLGALRRLATQPAAQGLLGPALSALPTGSALALWLDVEGDRFELAAEATGTRLPRPLVDRAGAFAPPPALGRAGDAAEALVYRDYAGFLAARAELFPPETLPSFSEPLSILSLLFGGLDFGEDYLPDLSPWIRLVARDVEFEPRVAPENPFPALCAVAELRDAERRGPEAITAFQTLIGILNADRAQERGGMMRLSLGLEGETEITSARFLPPGPEDGVDMKYNLVPACAIVGPYLVLGTHVDLVRDVVRRIQDGPGAEFGAREGRDLLAESLRISPGQLVRSLDANLDTLVMRKVLDEGVSAEAAREELGGLRLLLTSLRGLGLESTVSPRGERVRASLSVQLSREGTAR